MMRFVNSQYFLIRCFGILLLLGFITLGAIGGCSNNGGGQDGTQALTENDFAEDPSLSALAGGSVVVHFLEPPAGQTATRDTGGIGDDVIPFRYRETSEHTLCWEDDDPGAAHFMTLVDRDGQELLRVDANGDCVTEIIERGNYEMRLRRDGLSGDTLPIFIQPVIQDQEAKNIAPGEGIIKTVKRIFQDTFRDIEINTEARAQTVAQNIQTLLKTLSCNNCDLKNANLANAALTKAQLQMADLSGAVLTGANLAQATIIQSNMSEAEMSGVNMSGAEVFGTDLSMVNLTMANLFQAELLSCNVNGANLFGADMRMGSFENSSLVGTNLNEVNLSGATLCDPGCVCGANSIGTCAGCPSQDTCTMVKDG